MDNVTTKVSQVNLALDELKLEINKQVATSLLSSYQAKGLQGVFESTKALVDEVFEDENQ